VANSKLIDCIYIASPNSMHFEHTLLFLKNKKHVIREKPIFSNKTEHKKAYEVAEANNVYLYEAMRSIVKPDLQLLKDNLNKCGKIPSVVLNYSKYSSRYTKVLNGEEPNIFSLNFSGGSLVDLGVYPLSAAVSLFGKPVETTYYPTKITTGVDGSGTLI